MINNEKRKNRINETKEKQSNEKRKEKITYFEQWIFDEPYLVLTQSTINPQKTSTKSRPNVS